MAVTANKSDRRCVRLAALAPVSFAGAFSVLMLLADPASAIEWKFSPYVGAQATVTDNANQSHSDPQDALILSLTPGFSLYSQGSRRVQAAMNYGLTGVARFGNDSSTNLYHNLGANGHAELVDDLLFIDGSASVSQQLISLLGSPADAVTNPSNRATVGSYLINPYLQKRLGTFARAKLGYTASGSLFQNNAANNISSNSINATLDSGTQFRDLSWGLNYFLRDATVQSGQDTRFERYGGSLGYALTHHVRAFGTLGYDSNEYTAVPGSQVSGRYWTAGLGWSPNRRTSMDASVGESYFGRTHGFHFNYRTHYSVWTASYDDGISDIAQQLLNTQPLFAWICDGGLFYAYGTLPPSGQSNCTPLGVAPVGSVQVGLANGIYVSKTFRGGATWSKSRTSLGLNVFDVRRQYQQIADLPEDETRGIGATYAYRLQPHTTLNAGLLYTNNQVPAGLGTLVARNDDLYTATLGVTHQFDARLSGSLTYLHQRRNSIDPASDFDENRITAYAHVQF